MQAGLNQDHVRRGLIVMLPRLKRFAEVLVGDKRAGAALLARALSRMLAEQHRYQRGTPLDRWAFAEIYRRWLHELRDHADPMQQVKAGDGSFDRLFFDAEGGGLDAVTIGFLSNLTPQQRSALLLVYGEGFDYEDASRVLDTSPDAIATRLLRASTSLADRLGRRLQEPAAASVEMLYPRGTAS